MSNPANTDEQKKAYDLAIRCINNVPYGQWVKAGTIGTYVSTALGSVGAYNKPSIKWILSRNPGLGTIYEHNPDLGYRSLPSSDRPAISLPPPTPCGGESEAKSSSAFDKTVGAGRPAPEPRPSSTVSVISSVRDVVFLSDGTVTSLAVPGCPHRVLIVNPAVPPSCAMCGLRFRATKPLTELFSNPSVMEALATAFADVKLS